MRRERDEGKKNSRGWRAKKTGERGKGGEGEEGVMVGESGDEENRGEKLMDGERG